MPRAAFKVQGAPNKTRWTLKSPTRSIEKEEEANMQANGFHFHDEPPLPRYESFDGSEYSLPASGRADSSAWRPPPGTANGGYYNDSNYNTPIDERASHTISLNTRVRSQNLASHDAVGQHLLYETALLDSQAFESLDITDVGALKKEHTRLNARVDAANRKLALESKVKDAAQNLQRLYSAHGSHRPDTPQSPDSPRKSRGSLGMKGRTSSGSGTTNAQPLHQADNELAASVKKVDELNESIKGLLDRRQNVERKLLRHTAAVLADQTVQKSKISGKALSGTPLTNGHIQMPDEDANSYMPNEFDGIRDILHGLPAGANDPLRNGSSVQKLQEEHGQQMASVQGRLEQLNSQMRHVLDEVSRTRGKPLGAEPQLPDQNEDVNARLDARFNRLEDNLRALERENQEVKVHYKHVQDSAFMTRNAVEEQLEGLNHQVHNTLLLSADMQSMQSLRDPPKVTGHGYQQQLQYLAESLAGMDSLLRQHNEELGNARAASEGASRSMEEAHTKANTHAQKTGEYETVLGGLWEILQSDRHISRTPSTLSIVSRDSQSDGPLSPPHTPLKEDFSLQAFSSRVQHLFDRAQSAKEQQDILKRQVQQQRELNGKSDAEKDRQLTDLQGKHDQLAANHDVVHEELAKVMEKHARAENEASQSRSELMNVMNELGNFKRAVDNKQQERDEMARQLQHHQTQAVSMQEQLEQLESQVSDLTDDARIFTVETDAKQKEAVDKHKEMHEQLQAAHSAREAVEQRHGDTQRDMQTLDLKVVQLSMELAQTKADLDLAQGSRAERAKEAQTAEGLTKELEDLRSQHQSTLAEMDDLRQQPVNTDRAQLLERELHEMTNEYQDLTRESVELEKERGQLEELIDGLRDRCDALESQLTDEKVRWLGIRSPTGLSAESGGREMSSMMVMRQEFKKMMREARAEGVRLLRVSLHLVSTS